MRRRLLEILECPACAGADWQLRTLRVEPGASREIEDALLTCRVCHKIFPVVGGIPRMLPDSMDIYRGRFEAYGVSARTFVADADVAEFRKTHGSTRERFGFEWLRYEVTGMDENAEFFRKSTGLKPGDLNDRLVLDAGCGMGRYMEVAAASGAEVVGLDLSESVERAWRESRYRDRIHLVQGNILRPPLKASSFDVAYSIGVLHHTPDTRAAFRSMARLVRPGGRVSIWVYRTFQPEIPVGVHKRMFEGIGELVSDGTRLFTTRMPPWLLHYLCYAAVPLGWLKLQGAKPGPLRYFFWPFRLLPVSPHPKPHVRLCDTFDWLAPKYQWKHTHREVHEWFEAEGMSGVEAMDVPVSVTGLKLARERAPYEGRPVEREADRLLATGPTS